jgi:hypothetical protein
MLVEYIVARIDAENRNTIRFPVFSILSTPHKNYFENLFRAVEFSNFPIPMPESK